MGGYWKLQNMYGWALKTAKKTKSGVPKAIDLHQSVWWGLVGAFLLVEASDFARARARCARTPRRRGLAQNHARVQISA